MNREIKFRLYDKVNKFMVYASSKIYINMFGKVVLEDIYDGEIIEANKDTYVLMQSIGLYDKFGEEIYERDIVKANDYVGIVKYGEFDIYKMAREQSDEAADLLTFTSAYGWYIAFQDGTDYLFDNNTEEWLEVTGNIYEHSELLEAANE